MPEDINTISVSINVLSANGNLAL